MPGRSPSTPFTSSTRKRPEFPRTGLGIGPAGSEGRVWCGFGVALVWLWCGFGVALVWLWCGFGVALVWLWCGFGVALVGLWGGLGVALVWLWCGFGVALVWLWWRFGVAWRWLWCGFVLRSLCLVYAYNMALGWLWVTLRGRPPLFLLSTFYFLLLPECGFGWLAALPCSRFKVRRSTFDVQPPAGTSNTGKPPAAHLP